MTPGAHPYAVLSYDYWTRRFGRDPKVIGRTLRIGDQLFEIVGVGPETFTGTEPGVVTEVFLPTMMYHWVQRSDAQLASYAGDFESGGWHRAAACEVGRSQPELRDGAGQGVDGYVEAGDRQFAESNVVD